MWIGYFLLAVFLPVSVNGERELTDDRKKDAVYEMYRGYKKNFPSVADISPTAAMALLKQEAVVFIDTRNPEEMEVSMLPAAIVKEAYLKAPASFGGKTLVAYCTVGYRSGVFALEMETKGIVVRNLSGGIVAWALEGGPLYDKNGETKRVHVYGEKWNYAPEGYEAVVFGFLQKLLN